MPFWFIPAIPFVVKVLLGGAAVVTAGKIAHDVFSDDDSSSSAPSIDKLALSKNLVDKVIKDVLDIALSSSVICLARKSDSTLYEQVVLQDENIYDKKLLTFLAAPIKLDKSIITKCSDHIDITTLKKLYIHDKQLIESTDENYLPLAMDVAKSLNILYYLDFTSDNEFVISPSSERLQLLQKFSLLCSALEEIEKVKDGSKEVFFASYAKTDEQFAVLLDRWEKLHETSNDSTPRVAVCGLLNTGKSSLLNMLTDHFEEERFPTANRRVTTKVSEYLHEGILYVDTPGLGVNDADERRAREAFLSADAILFTHTVRGELVQSEMENLKKLKEERRDIVSSMLVVLTWEEEFTDDQAKRDRLTETITRQITSALDACPKIISVSNTTYLKGKLEKKNKLCEVSGIPALKAEIASLLQYLGDIGTSRNNESVAVLQEMREHLLKVREYISKQIADAKNDDRREYARLVKNFAELKTTWKRKLDEL